MDVDSYDESDDTFIHGADILEHFSYLKNIFPPNLNTENKTKPSARNMANTKRKQGQITGSSTIGEKQQRGSETLPEMFSGQIPVIKQEIDTDVYSICAHERKQTDTAYSVCLPQTYIKQEHSGQLSDSFSLSLGYHSMETEPASSTLLDKSNTRVKKESLSDHHDFISPEIRAEVNTSVTDKLISDCGTMADSHAAPSDVDLKTDISTNQSSDVAASSFGEEVSERSRKVCFIIKGKLGPDVKKASKYVRAILMEKIDSEEVFFENVVGNVSAKQAGQESQELLEIINRPEINNQHETGHEVLTQFKEQRSAKIDIECVKPIANPSSTNIKPIENSNNSKSSNVHSPKDLTDNLLTSEHSDSKYGHLPNYNLMSVIANARKSVKVSYPVQVSQQSQFSTQTASVLNTLPVSSGAEPSLAEIRASLYPSQKVTSLLNPYGEDSFEDSSGSPTMNVSPSSSTANEKVENIKTPTRSGRIIQSNKPFYDLTMDDFGEIEDEKSSVLTEGIKGGRSDPDNPFAITSPSFSDAGAKALLTTTQTSTATIVTVSVMSIGGRDKLIPQVTKSDAAAGGIVSIGNPIKTGSSTSDKSCTSIEGTKDVATNKDTDSTSLVASKIDRLDINIKIEDKQFKGSGDNKRWCCSMCDKSYTTKHNLVTHILDHMGVKPHLCLLCGKYFKQLCHLNSHMLTHDKVRPYTCNTCGKGFTQIGHLRRHETVHSGKPHRCDICDRGFAFPSELRIHKAKHISQEEKCSVCGDVFPSHRALQHHKNATKHGVRDDLTCTLCDKSFPFPSLLRDHMMKHDGVRPYQCPQCDMDFMKEHHLKAHMLTHTGEKPFECEICGRAFNQKTNLNRHRQIHKEQPKLECDLCSKTFSQPQTLKAHMVTHQEDKPYKCEVCGKQFSRRHNLQGHMHLHSNSRPFVCSLCQATFTLKSNLNRHKRYKHGLDESTEKMEVDAVTFLSDRAPLTSTPDGGTLGDLEAVSRSTRRGRKSKPSRHVSMTYNEGDINSDADLEEGISYSDEERENERLIGVHVDDITHIKDRKCYIEKSSMPISNTDSAETKEGNLSVAENYSSRASNSRGKNIVQENSSQKRLNTEMEVTESQSPIKSRKVH